MARLSEQQINNILIRCNDARMEQLLDLCLDPESGITIEKLAAVHYNKIEQLRQRYSAQAEEIVWAKSQDNIDALRQFIASCERGTFTTLHLPEAKDKLKQLAALQEDKDWFDVKASGSIDAYNSFIQRCKDGTYSSVHLQEAIDGAEFIDWNTAQQSRDPNIMNGFIQKINAGIYSQQHLKQANELLEGWANGTIVEDWSGVMSEHDDDQRLNKLNEFIQKYAMNPTATAQRYVKMASNEIDQISENKKAREDWISAKDENTILGYVRFVSEHPKCKYREEADEKISSMKESVLSDMKRFPFKYGRETMYEYISTGALTMEDLVDNSDVLTDRAYSHIKRYPRLRDEQRDLPVSRLEDPQSEADNTDIYFFGVSGSGKTCVLSGLMSLQGQLGFRFDPKGPGGGGNYAMELRNYAKTSMLPPATDQNYIQVIDGQINDERGITHKISLIEMSGEKTAEFAAIENPTSLEDLGTGAAGLLGNDNRKVIFFVIDPTNEKNVQMGRDSNLWVMQSDVLSCVSSLLSKNKGLMKRVEAIHVILTKSDTLGDYVSESVILDRLTSQGYQGVLEDIKSLCEQYNINKQTNFSVGLYPFCIGKFMPGDVYTFDNTDSLKILRVIQKNTEGKVKEGWMDKLRDFFSN